VINKPKILLLVLAGIFCHSAVAQYDIAITDSIMHNELVLSDLFYYEDPGGEFTFKDISNPKFQKNFKKNPHYIKSDFQPDVSYWIRLKIKHNPESTNLWLLEFYDQTIDEIFCYMPQPGGEFQTQAMGDMFKFPNRKFRHKNFEVILNNSQDSVMTYYFRVKSHETADVRIVVRSFYRFLYHAITEYLFFGLFYGILFSVALYNLLMASVFRDYKYHLYIFYLLSLAVYSASRDGIAFQYLWPDAYQWNQIAVGTSIYAMVLGALLFTRSFLKTDKKFPLLDKVILWWVIIRTLIFMYAMFVDTALFSYRIIEIIPVSIILYSSIAILQKGYKPARFMVIAHAVLFTGFIIKSLVDSGMIAFNPVTHYSLRIAFVIEMIFLTLALCDRVRLLKITRDQIQRRIIREHEINAELTDKVNKELEQKIKERTLELDEKNSLLEESYKKLSEKAEQINKMNSVLDLDNWKLKKEIRSVLHDRFLNKELSYEDFKWLFPDELSCYRLLEEIKWENGFLCTKCGNDKYSRGKTKFSRRCTKCGYEESVTVNTVFHGIKFPINKALFIHYLTKEENGKYTFVELSEILNLRPGTISNFKRKIAGITNGHSNEIVLFGPRKVQFNR
jgi:hypothetical protein